VTESSDTSTDRAPTPIDPLPAGVTAGSTVLVAGMGDPSRHAVGFQVLSRLGDAEDRALVVTTTESADETVATAEAVHRTGDRPSLGIVDTVSKQQSVAAPTGDVPVVFTPSPGDLERLVVALTELSADDRLPEGARHLVVRSLTPVLDVVPSEQVCAVIRQLSGLRTESGVTLLGIDHTAHDEATMAALVERVDGVLRVTPDSDGGLSLEYRPASGRFEDDTPPGRR